MKNQYDWNLIRSFLACLDAGSLLGAARQLRLSQPTLGRHIAELESQLGLVLFERTGRGLTPSTNALGLADAARAMEAASFQLARKTTAARSPESGTVRITASQPVACFLLPPMLAQMRLALPGIQIELESSNAETNLLRREADIALRMVRPKQATLIARKVGNVKIGAYASTSYLARRGIPRTPGDLLKHDLIGYDRNDEMVRGFQALDSSVGRGSFALRSDDLIVHWQAVLAGLGIGFVAVWLGHSTPQVQRLLPDLALPDFPIWLTVHREIRTNPHIRAVYDYLGRHVGQHVRP